MPSPETTEWLTIESAPICTEILVWDGYYCFVASKECGGWIAYIPRPDNEPGEMTAVAPTHWMPLPEPPT